MKPLPVLYHISKYNFHSIIQSLFTMGISVQHESSVTATRGGDASWSTIGHQKEVYSDLARELKQTNKGSH